MDPTTTAKTLGNAKKEIPNLLTAEVLKIGQKMLASSLGKVSDNKPVLRLEGLLYVAIVGIIP